MESNNYNPSKLPVYLGIFALDDAPTTINGYVQDALKDLSEHFSDDKNISQHLADYESASFQYKNINDLHVTSLFIGGNQKKKDTVYFKSFKEGHSVDINLVGVAIVPGKIVTGICYPDQSVIKIENAMPHVTLLQGGWAPKFSNDVLEALFLKGKPYHDVYKNNGFETAKDRIFIKQEITIGKETVTAYVIQTKALTIPSKTKGFGGK